MANSEGSQTSQFKVSSWTKIHISTSRTIEDEQTEQGKEWLEVMKCLSPRTLSGFIRAVYGRVLESPETVWLVTAWESPEALDTFEKSSAYTKQHEQLSEISSGPLSTQRCNINGEFWNWLSEGTAVTDAYFPASLSPEQEELAMKARGLVYFVSPGLKKPMDYTHRGNRGFVQGKVEYHGQECVVLRFLDYWKSKENEDKFKKSQGVMKKGARYISLTENLEEQLKEAGMLGMEEVHCKFTELPRYFD